MSLELADVTVTYPDGGTRVTALDGVSLRAAAGTVTAVVGPSGSGKSTLLAAAATLVPPDAGRVVVDGRDVAGLSASGRARLRRERVGLVFQQPNLLPALTVADQLAVPAHLNGRSPRTVRHRV
ncbi:ATP-binding cassette domain-containing protein, partial [Saccharomonospora iraqiensis]|uniref:ATP-binding cassette domain-containing protein n=1 Tax=Saccharomonospora iraqiensis TaxID=52698 RepID=UPI0005955043